MVVQIRWLPFYYAFVYTRKLLLRTVGRGEGDLPLRILKLKWCFLFVGKSVSSLWRN